MSTIEQQAANALRQALARGAKSALTTLFSGLSGDFFAGLAVILCRDPAPNPPNADRNGVLYSSGSAL